MSPARIPPAAIVYLAGFVTALHVGKLPPSLPALRDALGVGLVEAGWLVSAFQVAGMCLGLFGGLIADRFGLRRTMACGLALTAVASVAGALATDVGVLLATRVGESAGFILAVLPGPALLRRVTPLPRMNLAMGVWGSYMPAGMALALVVAPWLLAAADWRLVWLVAALASALVCALVLAGLPADPPHAAARVRVAALARDTLGSRGPWLLAACFGLYAGQWMVVFSFLPTIYGDAGMSPAAAGSATALGVAVNLVGNVAAGPLLQRGVPRQALLAAGSLTMIVCAWLTFDESLPFAWRYAGVLMFSAVGGLIPGSLFATAPRFAPYPGAVSTTTGLMQQGSSLGQFIVPPVVAALASVTGTWRHTWLLTGALAACNIVLALLIGRVARSRDDS